MPDRLLSRACVRAFCACQEAIEKYGRLDVISKNYDVLLIATCSYGCGEPPVNMHALFDQLMNNAVVGSLSTPPLEGMQHAVLGYGGTLQRA